ncbi:hypothetical protein HDK77DRAFT_309296 [Phyllosticta capitalensis]
MKSTTDEEHAGDWPWQRSWRWQWCWRRVSQQANQHPTQHRSDARCSASLHAHHAAPPEDQTTSTRPPTQQHGRFLTDEETDRTAAPAARHAWTLSLILHPSRKPPTLFSSSSPPDGGSRSFSTIQPPAYYLPWLFHHNQLPTLATYVHRGRHTHRRRTGRTGRRAEESPEAERTGRETDTLDTDRRLGTHAWMAAHPHSSLRNRMDGRTNGSFSDAEADGRHGLD